LFLLFRLDALRRSLRYAQSRHETPRLSCHPAGPAPALTASASAAAPAGELAGDFKLWYRKPAEKWVDGLPIGNGRLGAMVLGGVPEERIFLNEDTLWSGFPAPAATIRTARSTWQTCGG